VHLTLPSRVSHPDRCWRSWRLYCDPARSASTAARSSLRWRR
jgi:hypothetical protein